MAIFSFGSSRSKSTSTSESEGFSRGGSLSGSTSFSDALSRSRGVSGSSQSVFAEDFLQQLYGGATNAAMRAAGMAPGLSGSARALFTGGTRFLEQLGGGAGADFLRERLEGGGLADERIGLLQEDIGRFLREEALPGVEARAVGAYGLGGARQGLAEGRAIEGATRELARGATEIRGQEQERRDAIARDLMLAEQTGAATGLAALPGLFGLAEAEFGAEMAPWERLAGILGGPTTLTESFAEQSADSIAQSLSESFGISFNEAQQWARAQSQSSGRSSNLGFGGFGGG